MMGIGIRMGRSRIAVLTLVATTFVASGCGKSTSTTLTRAELTKKANTICESVKTKIASVNHSANNIKDIAIIAPKLAAFEQDALAELGKLVPPADLANDWKEFVAGAQTLADNTVKLGEYAKANNLAKAQSLITSSNTVQQKMRATAKQDGFISCEEVP
jgi:multidrug efflux pump subunit AcrA (membrane-fusion protein)